MEKIIADTAKYDRVIDAINRVMNELNKMINGDATFGYIGNLSQFRDDRAWYVFLPHPGRVGTAEDRLGGFSTGDINGARHTLTALSGALTMTRYLRANYR